MIELIILFIFIISLGGVAFILARKLPNLVSLPQNGTTGIRKHYYIVNIENKIKEISVFFEKQIFFHKFLSWVKVMTLKVERKVDNMLHKIRQKNRPV